MITRQVVASAFALALVALMAGPSLAAEPQTAAARPDVGRPPQIGAPLAAMAVAPGVYWVNGGPSNSGFIVGDQGVVAIDAQTLAQALAAEPNNIDQALIAFEARALHFGKGVVERARGLGAYLEGQHKPFEARTPAQRSRDIRIVMQEHGAALTNELLHSSEAAH